MADAKIMTVRGSIEPSKITAMVTHEHVIHTFGEPPTTEPAYDLDRVFEIGLPALRGLLAYGCNAVVDCTTEYFGRSVETLKSLSEQSDVHIITNTGYYGAADDIYVPDHAYTDSPEELADRWTAEWVDGIRGTEIRPGFIKTGVDSPGPLSEIDAKLVRAAAITHVRTGLIIEVHSPLDGSLATEELDILAEEGVAPEAWIWVHADTVTDVDSVVDAAARGAWVEFDSISRENLSKRVALLSRMKAENLLSRVLLSHDESSYASDRTETVPVHITLFKDLIPLLLESDFSSDDIRLMTVENPREAFSIRVRAGKSSNG